MNAPIDITGVKLETARLWLRPFEPSDLTDFNAYCQVPGGGECAGWKHHESLEESQKILDLFLKEKKTLALVEKATGRLIGSIGLEEYHSELPPSYEKLLGREIGYALAQDKWGQGLMTEAARRVLRYGFEELGLDFFVCAHFAGNERSRRVIEKCGFRPLGTDLYKTRIGTVEENHFYVLDNPARKGLWP